MIKMHFAEGGDRVNEVSSSGFFGGITENISVFYELNVQGNRIKF